MTNALLTTDWHQHSEHSVDCRATGRSLARVTDEMAALGVTAYGISDHLHTPLNLPDIVAARADYLATDRPAGFRFGVEVSVVSAWELGEIAAGRVTEAPYGVRSGGPAGAAPALALQAEHVAELGIEYVVGGTHWPLYAPLERQAIIRDYHRQNLFLATHPLVTVVAHPWWWMGHWREDIGPYGMYRHEPWLDDFRHVPAAMHDEFVAAVLQHGKVVEANLWACLCNPCYPERFRRQYAETLADWQARGVVLSFGSDDHGVSTVGSRARDQEEGQALLTAAGVKLADFWRGPA